MFQVNVTLQSRPRLVRTYPPQARNSSSAECRCFGACSAGNAEKATGPRTSTYTPPIHLRVLVVYSSTEVSS